MKFLLCQNLVYLPSHGGANKSNRMLLELLSGRGHHCLAITPAAGVQAPQATPAIMARLQSMGVTPAIADGRLTYTYNGVQVEALLPSRHLAAEFQAAIARFSPDWVIISSEDTFYSLLAVAARACPEKTIYLARTTLLLPFGPDASLPDETSRQRLATIRRLFAVSSFIQQYIERWAGLQAHVLPLSFYGQGPFPNLAPSGNGFVTMVNPCAVKGISLFLDLARAMPQVSFAAVVTWGSTSADIAALRQLTNVELWAAEDDIENILRRTKALLVPSLWAEGKGEIVIEAMLRGIPVLAADTGGLPEAKLGVDYVLPVNAIHNYCPGYDERMVPVPVVPVQEITPWRSALHRLLTDPEHYAALSRASQSAALQYAQTATIQPFLDMLAQVRENL